MDYYQESLMEEAEYYRIALDRGDLDEKSQELFQRQLQYITEKLDKIQFFKSGRGSPVDETIK